MQEPGSAGEHQAQAMFGTGRRALAFYNKQMLDYLNEPMRDFIAQREFVFISTADSRGECDCSFRAGPRGFVQSLDDRTLIYPGTAATASWRASATFWGTRISACSSSISSSIRLDCTPTVRLKSWRPTRLLGALAGKWPWSLTQKPAGSQNSGY